MSFVLLQLQTRGTPSVMSKNIGAVAAASRRGQAYLMVQRGDLKGSSPRPSLKAGAAEHASVTLDDVKSVALDSMPDVELLPPSFQGCYRFDVSSKFTCDVLFIVV